MDINITEQKICVACGTEFAESKKDHHCPICEEERQFVPESGQEWTTHTRLKHDFHVEIKQIRQRLYELLIKPHFAIGQRAFLLLSESGNILWDCLSLLDEQTIHFIKSKGGLQAIAISHPHYYTAMNRWANAFDCPIHIHQKDRKFIAHQSKYIKLWKGPEKKLWDDVTIVNLGGHFDGGSILLITEMTKHGIMLSSDILQIAKSRKFISMMYSYPNYIPLPLGDIRRIRDRLHTLDFDTVYGAFSHQNLTQQTRNILEKSIERYFL